MAAKKNLLDFVPEAFRGEGDASLMANIALMNLINEGADIDHQVGYLSGLKKHIEFVSDDTKQMKKEGPTEGWRWYSDTITEVTIIERLTKDKKKVIGRKAQIKFASNEVIDTDWVEFSFSNHDIEMHWDMALARTIQVIAEENINRKVSVLKKVWNDGGVKGGRRQVINLKATARDDDDVEDTAKFSPVTIKGGIRVAKDLDIPLGEDIENDINELVKAINDGAQDHEKVLEFVQKHLDDNKIKASKDDVEAFSSYEDSGVGTQLLAYGISLIDGNL